MPAPKLSPMPMTVLTSGLSVGNFSSPYEFNFDDGTMLQECKADRVRAGSLNVREEVMQRNTRFTLVNVCHQLTNNSVDMLIESAYQPGVDLIIVPRVVISATVKFIGDNRLRKDHELWYALKKCATIRMQDRQNKIAYHNRFCCG